MAAYFVLPNGGSCVSFIIVQKENHLALETCVTLIIRKCDMTVNFIWLISGCVCVRLLHTWQVSCSRQENQYASCLTVPLFQWSELRDPVLRIWWSIYPLHPLPFSVSVNLPHVKSKCTCGKQMTQSTKEISSFRNHSYDIFQRTTLGLSF